ncbi:hypothetical protein [Streptomyces albireticuli]|uniref:Uncharacterized protein n=1 Tax=Streptomyces albireticuli TaxID=1940 RepID=A0A2A2D8T2_9ACTN|nr:hypothetical protein [Streptomyces albireticuli]MCD9144809.1 hypothetical protein [Streptomyces albireticuli]MCD9165678.1 hypothetical protein [Streptomyces albireticuli]MCD9193716.1 hypothetical protein [Streptomyces albireticuli]PAU47925.1 hypothetical protein CK936_15950 [Streptomyces albireticuli]
MSHDTPRTSHRDVRRRAGRFAVALALALPAAVLATPAHAASSCVVNDVPMTGPVINGTEQADTIACSSVAAGTLVDALGGDDTIVLNGRVDGSVRAGDGNDRVALGRRAELTERGELDGQRGRDNFDLGGKVLGAVRGGQDADRFLADKTVTMGPSTDLRGARGADVIDIEIPVVVRGLIEGVEDDDRITVEGTVARDGRVLGGTGNDDIRVGENRGVVDGGPDTDHCVVTVGNPPVNCES